MARKAMANLWAYNDLRKMTKDFCHLVMVPMTGLGLHDGYRGDKWFAYRIELFKNYTLESLLNQTNRNFTIWISFRPEEQDNPLTRKFYQYMSKTDQPFVFTFGGLCFWDDKYPDNIEKDRLQKHLEASLPELEEVLAGKKYAYMTIQPSDDVYHTRMIESIQQQEYQFKRALIHWKGYVFNEQTKQLAEWKPFKGHLPPFYTIMYPADVFLDPKKHFDYMRGFRSHEDITKLFNCIQLPDYRYCVLTHEKNISTAWNWHRLRFFPFLKKIKHPFIKREFKGREKEEILNNFKIKL